MGSREENIGREGGMEGGREGGRDYLPNTCGTLHSLYSLPSR